MAKIKIIKLNSYVYIQLQGEDVELVEEVVDDLPKEKLKDLSEKTAKVAHAAEDLKDKV